MASRRGRLLVREHHRARRAGQLTERTRQALWRLRHGRPRHVGAPQPAEVGCRDPFSIGQLKGVGKVWPVTAGEAASSFGSARILPTLSPAATARVVRTVVVPPARRAGWRGRRGLTDRGHDCPAEFAETWEALGIRQIRITTRPAGTNGFVERRQPTILREHWRGVFRRHDGPESGDVGPPPARVHAVLQL